MNEMTRLSVNIPIKTLEKIKDIAERNGTNVTYTIRRMTEIWLLLEETRQGGEKIFVTKEGKLREIILV